VNAEPGGDMFMNSDNLLPSVSIVIPTLNSENVLKNCLDSIRALDYPQEKIEIIIADGGSQDKTIEIASDYADVILPNPLLTGEAGKSVGVEAAKNEIIALIDSDNLIDGKDWLRRMVDPFKDREIVGTEPVYYTYRREDSLITRYSALLGMNDPLCLYLGNYDRYSHLTDRWTELSIETSDCGDYFLLQLDEKNIPTIGANGFLVRRDAIQTTNYKPYLFDIDVVYELVRSGNKKFAKVKIGIIHIFAGDTATFVRKQRRRIRDFLYYKKKAMRTYPWHKQNKAGILRFAVSTCLVVPLLFTSMKGYRRINDRAWFYHIVACWVTLWVYGSESCKDLIGIEAGIVRK
jgi:glycosyltransferase involved in cell wall biosynthesis